MPKIVRTAPGAELEVFTMQRPGKVLGTLAIPVRDHMNAATATSLLMSDFSWIGPDESITRLIVQGSILTLQRNECIQRMEGDWILFIDDDMVWDTDTIKRLLDEFNEGDYDMLGALCFRRSPPHQPTIFYREQPTSGNYNFLEHWDSDIVEVDATGMAFVIIHRRVFEAIAGTSFPPMEVRLASPPPNFFRWEGTLGEDLAFCQAAKNAGCRIFVDTRLEIGHVSERTIRKQEYLRELAFRPDEVIAQRRKVNDAMNMPTVSREEAMAALELQR